MDKTLTKQQFDVLTELERSRRRCTQRELAGKLGLSLGLTNKLINQLSEPGYVSDGIITDKGLEALAPYKVERAVIMAAGFGSRLLPITLNTPKPMVRVNGRRMIETTLDVLVDIGIREIYVVRGYLKEEFDILLYKYPMIKFIDNPLYNVANNISSAMVARELLHNAYVLDADLYLTNPELITKYQYSSNYLGIPVERTDDWCFSVKNGIIDSITVGGINCYTWVGLSYWTEEDGRRMCEDIKKVFESPGGKERYWDQVPMDECKKSYRVAIRVCKREDIVEIDTLSDLRAIDKSYIE